jgi:hypothetical protein
MSQHQTSYTPQEHQQHTYSPQGQQVVYTTQPVILYPQSSCCAGCLSAFLSCLFCPFCGLSSLCCFTLPTSKPIIFLFSGIGGLAATIGFMSAYGYNTNGTFAFEYEDMSDIRSTAMLYVIPSFLWLVVSVVCYGVLMFRH